MKLPPLRLDRVRKVRLLPVVIAAGCALLLLKGAGIMTGGGYVLTGSPMVQAADDRGGEAAAGDGDATMALPAEFTMTDDSPTLRDTTPTLRLRGKEDGSESTAAEESGEAPVADDGQGVSAGTQVAGATDCAPVGLAQSLRMPSSAGVEGDPIGAFDAGSRPDCELDRADSGTLDAPPLMRDGAGNNVPLTAAASENQILERLSLRREELEAREVEIDMRMALVEVAEKRIDERTAALEALEARISAMVDEKRMLEESQFTAVVVTYETMKPKDAAAIFDELEMQVLVRVARAISPRKLAPIMARMNPVKAKDLTAHLAVDQVEPTIQMTGQSIAELPQIIGQ